MQLYLIITAWEGFAGSELLIVEIGYLDVLHAVFLPECFADLE